MHGLNLAPPKVDPRRVEDCVSLLKREGYLILTDVVPAERIRLLDAELEDRFDRTPFCVGNFSGPSTKRFGALLKRSRCAQDLVLHPLMIALAEHILGPNCDSIQLNLTQAIEIHPGARAQVPHRDQDMYTVHDQGVELCLNVIWPTTRFTAENGATIVWPQSAHLHPFAVPDLDEAIRAEMAPGSALVFLGSTLHCAGANRTDERRRGLVIGYSLGWLKQYENQYLVYPPAIARTFPRRLAELVGYRTQRPNLNNYDGRCPSLLLNGRPDDHLGLVDDLPEPMASLIDRHAADPNAFLAQGARIMADAAG